MNGEFKELLDAIKIELAVLSNERKLIKEVRDRQHNDNTGLFNKIFDKINGLPCKETQTNIRWNTWLIRGVCVLLMSGLLKIAWDVWSKV